MLSPLYCTLTGCDPNGNALVVKVAFPVASTAGDEKIAPMVKVTVPLGIALEPPAPVTVAVKVTGLPKAAVAGLVP